MTSTGPPLPPLPPQSARAPGIPLQCFPKTDTLRQLIQNVNPNLPNNSNNNESFDDEERCLLREQDPEYGAVNSTLIKLLTSCEDYRIQAQTAEHKLLAFKEAPARIKQDAILSRAKYQQCLTWHACPSRMQSFIECWRNVEPNVVHELARHGMLNLVCKSEKQAVERCVGSLVSRTVRAADAGSVADIGGDNSSNGGDLWWLWNRDDE